MTDSLHYGPPKERPLRWKSLRFWLRYGPPWIQWNNRCQVWVARGLGIVTQHPTFTGAIRSLIGAHVLVLKWRWRRIRGSPGWSPR